MSTYNINQFTVDHLSSWGKWPDTDDLDYSSILEQRTLKTYTIGDDVFHVTDRYFPAYLPWIEAGILSLPIEFPWINNLARPPQKVLDVFKEMILSFCKENDVLVWQHARNCYPEVACVLPGNIKLSILPFADDCPGSSNIKTFPVAKNFDAVLHFLKVYDLATGEMIEDKYKELGVKSTYFKSCNPSVGLEEGLKAIGFNFDEKAGAVLAGDGLKNDFCFVGYAGWDGHRKQLCDDLNMTMFEAYGIKARIHGRGMKHGELPGFNDPDAGKNVAAIYADSLCSVNPQVSSLFNCRLMDLWISGVIQICFDPYRELESEGFYPYTHFIPYDGTIPGLTNVISVIKHDHELAYSIMRQAHVKALDYLKYNSSDAVYSRIYRDRKGAFDAS